MATKQKTHKNLNELNSSEIEQVAKKLKIPLLDHKEDTLKKLIRDKWKKSKIIELPVQGVIKMDKEPKEKMRKENYTFNRKFSSEELTQKSMFLSNSCISRNQLEDEKKAIVSQYKSKIDAETSKINLLAADLQRGSENVLKTCDVVYDYDKATKIFRYDRKEVGRERMNKIDYQLELQEWD